MVYHSNKNGEKPIGRVTQLCCSGYLILNKNGDRELLVKRRCGILGNCWWRQLEILTEEATFVSFLKARRTVTLRMHKTAHVRSFKRGASVSLCQCMHAEVWHLVGMRIAQAGRQE